MMPISRPSVAPRGIRVGASGAKQGEAEWNERRLGSASTYRVEKGQHKRTIASEWDAKRHSPAILNSDQKVAIWLDRHGSAVSTIGGR
jgi:hypothetical protein